MQDNTPVFPVATIDSMPIVKYELIALRMHFLSNQMQAPEQAEIGRFYALTSKQARYLASELTKHADTLDAAGPQSSPGTVQ